MKIIRFFYSPERVLKELLNKPNIMLPIFLALITPIFLYKNISNLIPENFSQYTLIIIIFFSLFSLFSYIISSFLIYILISLFPLEERIHFQHLLSIYGFIQIPKVFQSIAVNLGLLNSTLLTRSIFDYLLYQVLLNPFFYWQSYLFVLAISIITKLNKKWAFLSYFILFILGTTLRSIFF